MTWKMRKLIKKYDVEDENLYEESDFGSISQEDHEDSVMPRLVAIEVEIKRTKVKVNLKRRKSQDWSTLCDRKDCTKLM